MITGIVRSGVIGGEKVGEMARTKGCGGGMLKALLAARIAMWRKRKVESCVR
jgi:hypothetical protein